MLTRIVETEYDYKMLIIYLTESIKRPYTVTVEEGKHRSTAQNKLQRLWVNEIFEQLETGHTREQIRGFCKLTFGIAILCEQNDAFREGWERITKTMSYQDKWEMMQLPFDFPVTRNMNVKQKKEYLDRMHQFWSEKGVVLTDPDRFGEAA